MKKWGLTAVIAVCALPQLASAVPVLWSVNYANETANTTVTGSFTFDADLNLYTAINLTATDDVGISNTTYNFFSPFPGPEFRNQEDADRTGEKLLSILSFTPLTNLGGVISNSPAAVFFFFPIRCVNASCGTTQSLTASGAASASTMTGTPMASTSVPEPATLPVLLAGLGIFAMRRRWLPKQPALMRT